MTTELQRFGIRPWSPSRTGGYHYWTVVDRQANGESVEHFSARERGDAAARLAAHAFCTGANDGFMGALYEDIAQPITDDYMAGWSYGHEKRTP